MFSYLPGKLISFDGWMICPFSGRNTKGTRWADEPVPKGATEHSVDKKQLLATLLLIQNTNNKLLYNILEHIILQVQKVIFEALSKVFIPLGCV